ncbi:DUF4157 domain-containing protein [Aquimarina hainanensis]|uniref:DUF4157 domain-containing protein n=1 Tax=Aquimarina hainanensis TaxID=1578017 RepID=A0ABW5ND10_9FLAO
MFKATSHTSTTAGHQRPTHVLGEKETPFIQPKLSVGKSGDKYEVEADHMADQIVAKSNQQSPPFFSPVPTIQSREEQIQEKPLAASITTGIQLKETEEEIIQEKCEACEQEQVQKKEIIPPPVVQNKGEEEEALIQKKCEACEKEETVQKQEETNIVETNKSYEIESQKLMPIQKKCDCEEKAPVQRQELVTTDPNVIVSNALGALQSENSLESRLNNTKGKGGKLDKKTQEEMESGFGADFSNVNIHTDSTAIEMNKELGAQAFTNGNDIYFNEGKYNPDTTSGKHLLAHELTHTIQQGASSADTIQRFELPEFGVPDFVEDGLDTVSGLYDDTVDAVADGIYEVGETLGINDDVLEAYETVTEYAYTGMDYLYAGLDWLYSSAGEVARRLVESLGGVIMITSGGLIITFPKICPIEAEDFDIDIDAQEGEAKVPIFGIPIGPGVLTGEIGVKGVFDPAMNLQLGPFCLEGAQLVINPLSGNYTARGSVSATAAVSVGAEARAGLLGELSYIGVIVVGGVPVPIEIPLIGLEGGIAGLGRAIGIGEIEIGGNIGYSGGSFIAGAFEQLNLGLAGDLFLGAYGQMNILGENFCRLYWEPLAWHGDIGAFFNIAAGIVIGPSSSAYAYASASLGRFPFDQFDLILSRKGFSDDCPIKDKLCKLLEALHLLPSQNGGVWSDTGSYGPGSRLTGPLEVYEKTPPGRASGAECRGACGPDCETCTSHSTYRYTDPVSGETWEYTNFQDCDTHEGCREHDAAFDWAADKKGEIGKWAIIMPWHMAANIECTCDYPAGNCFAWVAGLPPYDGKMYFADTARKISGGGTGPGHGGTQPGNTPDCEGYTGGPPFGSDEVIGIPGGDFYHYSAAPVSGEFTVVPGYDRWTDYLTNCSAEAHAATGVPEPAIQYVTIVSGSDAALFIDTGQFNERHTTSVIYGVNYPYRHYNNHTAIPESCYTTFRLTIFTPDCSLSGGGATPSGDEQQDLERCDRHELPPEFCDDLYNRVIERFGNRDRDLEFDPDGPLEGHRFPDDAPIMERFRQSYNRLDSWNTYIATYHQDWFGEFTQTFQVEERRTEWMSAIKEETKEFKKRFRDIDNRDPEGERRRFEEGILQDYEERIDQMVQEIAQWYKTRSGSQESIEEIIERVHQEGTVLWRAAWRATILAVNRVLSRIWPPAKAALESWIGQEQGRHPNVDLSGSISDIDYIGSLARGFKSPSKQFVRFNPDNFDVDAFLVAPPLSKWAINFAPEKDEPDFIDKGRIWGRSSGIDRLISFADLAHTEFSTIEGYDQEEIFDVVLRTPPTPEQDRNRTGSDRLYEVREQLSPERYSELLQELQQAGLMMTDEEGRLLLREDLNEEEFNTFVQIIERYEQ